MERTRVDDVIAALDAGDIDAALESGLMELAGDEDLLREDVSPGDREHVLAAAARLRFAWDSRERYRARQLRLAERTRIREARRAQASPDATPSIPTLPTAAANALAKALARAQGR